MTKRVYENDFRMLIGSYPHGTDPSLNNIPVGNPPQLRTTDTAGPGWVTGEPTVFGAVSAGYTTQTGTIEVLDLDFSTGRCVLTLGEDRQDFPKPNATTDDGREIEIISGLHYLPGVDLGTTATNLAAVIARLPGYTVSVLGAVITVNYVSDVNAAIPFYVRHCGTIENLVLTPSDGFLSHGTPALGAPILTH